MTLFWATLFAWAILLGSEQASLLRMSLVLTSSCHGFGRVPAAPVSQLCTGQWLDEPEHVASLLKSGSTLFAPTHQHLQHAGTPCDKARSQPAVMRLASPQLQGCRSRRCSFPRGSPPIRCMASQVQGDYHPVVAEQTAFCLHAPHATCNSNGNGNGNSMARDEACQRKCALVQELSWLNAPAMHMPLVLSVILKGH